MIAGLPHVIARFYTVPKVRQGGALVSGHCKPKPAHAFSTTIKQRSSKP